MTNEQVRQALKARFAGYPIRLVNENAINLGDNLVDYIGAEARCAPAEIDRLATIIGDRLKTNEGKTP